MYTYTRTPHTDTKKKEDTHGSEEEVFAGPRHARTAGGRKGTNHPCASRPSAHDMMELPLGPPQTKLAREQGQHDETGKSLTPHPVRGSGHERTLDQSSYTTLNTSARTIHAVVSYRFPFCFPLSN